MHAPELSHEVEAGFEASFVAMQMLAGAAQVTPHQRRLRRGDEDDAHLDASFNDTRLMMDAMFNDDDDDGSDGDDPPAPGNAGSHLVVRSWKQCFANSSETVYSSIIGYPLIDTCFLRQSATPHSCEAFLCRCHSIIRLAQYSARVSFTPCKRHIQCSDVSAFLKIPDDLH